VFQSLFFWKLTLNRTFLSTAKDHTGYALISSGYLQLPAPFDQGLLANKPERAASFSRCNLLSNELVVVRPSFDANISVAAIAAPSLPTGGRRKQTGLNHGQNLLSNLLGLPKISFGMDQFDDPVVRSRVADESTTNWHTKSFLNQQP